MMRGDVLPNQTIYINNLSEKVKKEELKKSLYAVFSQFGKILDVVAAKTLKLRGQAWVVFDDVTSATNALRQMQGFPFYDKAMRISYAKEKSDVVTKADGTFVQRDKKKKGKKSQVAAAEAPPAAPAAAPGVVPGAPYGAPGYGAVPGVAAPYAAPVQPVVPEAPAPPNNVLFIQNLPRETTNEALAMLFQQFQGFKEVRTVETRPGIAFVEFEDENQSTVGLQTMHGFRITPANPMHVTYAKK